MQAVLPDAFPFDEAYLPAGHDWQGELLLAPTSTEKKPGGQK
jgi:hypothetical protein